MAPIINTAEQARQLPKINSLDPKQKRTTGWYLLIGYITCDLILLAGFY